MNIRDDLKTFYVGNRQGTAIYVGSTKVWPICNPQIVTVANPVPQGTTIVDPCSLVTDCTSFAANCPELVTVGALNGLGESLTEGGLLYFAQSPNLSEDSLQTIAESIGTAVSSNTSISFKSTAYDKLTDEQKSLITSKN